ncbi:hypothetical protein BH20ACT6_BH20ACT6_23420 [soil metagenome]
MIARAAAAGQGMMNRVITLELAQRLYGAGLSWEPAPGDRFVVPNRDMDDDVFVVSDMVVDVHDLPTGRVIGFNGTVEWALDSISATDVVWLPREEQLRGALGAAFVRLEAVTLGWVVVTLIDPSVGEERHADVDAERAYARALLRVLAR